MRRRHAALDETAPRPPRDAPGRLGKPARRLGEAATCLGAAAAVGLIACTASAEPAPLRIGSKRFTESYILAEIAAETARARAGVPVVHQQGLGGTALVFRALEEGSIDVYPDYTGTVAEAIVHTPGHADLTSLRQALAPRGIGIGDPLGFDNTYALAAGAKLAEARGLRTVSDLAAASDLRLGLSPEFLGRSDGFGALSVRYGLRPAHVQALEHGLAYEAITTGAIDVMDVYSTDAKIARYALRVLADDDHFFPAYQAVLLYRLEAARRAPQTFEALATLAGAIDAATMIRLNALAEIDGWTFPAIARSFVDSRQGRSPGAHDRRPSLLAGLVAVVRSEGPRHLLLVAVSLLFASLVGVPFGIAAARSRALGRGVLAATSAVQTLPALALLCFFVPVLGTGTKPALAALFLYALLPIVRNTLAGLDGIAPELRDAATALGLSPWTQLVRIELPLASRTILAGIRTSAVIAVGGATLAAFVGAGGFGAPISTGLNLDDTRLILEGAIPAALLALAVEGAFALLDRLVIPRGLRPRRSGENGA